MTSQGRTRPGWLIAVVAVALAAVGLLLFLGFDGIMILRGGRNPLTFVKPSPGGVAETKGRAERIVAALEHWKATHGEYPASLSDLVPSELPEIARPSIGDRRWNYKRPTPTNCVLDFFEGPIYEHTWWDSATGWQGDH